MPKCPNCGTEVEKPFKKWVLKNPRTNVDVEVGLFVCPSCAKKFRNAHKI